MRSQCPGCGTLYKITQEHLGRQTRCKRCGHNFVIKAVTSETPQPAAQPRDDSQPPSSFNQGDSVRVTTDEKREVGASPSHGTSSPESNDSGLSPETKTQQNSGLHQQFDGVVPPVLEQGVVQSLSNRTFFKWFIAVNAGVMITAMILLQNVAWPLLITIIGFAGSFISLFFSKRLAMKVHRIKAINPQRFKNDAERNVYEMVQDLARSAGLPKAPDVAIYKSPDINAFATGASQDDSLVAFSSALMKKLSLNEIKAVAAHEVAHIANHDMLGTVLIQGVINTIALLVTIPFKIVQFIHIATSDEDDVISTLNVWLLKLLSFLAHITVMAIGTLCSLAFSRKREYRADHMAALMVGPENMISALTRLKEDDVAVPVSQAEFAAFKVSGKVSIAELFSTHPEMDKRIEALRNPPPMAQAHSDLQSSSCVGQATQPEQEAAAPEIKMNMQSQCPSCGALYHIVREHLGQNLQCQNCGDNFVIETVSNGSSREPRAQPQSNPQPQTQPFVAQFSQMIQVTCQRCGTVNQMPTGVVCNCGRCGQPLPVSAPSGQFWPAQVSLQTMGQSQPTAWAQSSVTSKFAFGQILTSSFSILVTKPVVFWGLAIMAGLPQAFLLVKNSGAIEAARLAGEEDVLLMSIVGILDVIMGMFMEACAVYTVFKVLRHQVVTLEEAYNFSKARMLSLFGASILVGLSVGLGTVAFIIPGVILMVLLAMTIPACAFESLGILDSMKRSVELTKGYRLPIFGLYLITGISSAALALLFLINNQDKPCFRRWNGIGSVLNAT